LTLHVTIAYTVITESNNSGRNKMVITWQTTKTESGYEYRVYSFGYQVPSVTLATGKARTRAIATRLAKQHAIYQKRLAERAAA